MICSIQDEGGRWLHNINEIGNHIVNYFEGIFQSSNPLHFSMLNVLFPIETNHQENLDLRKILEPHEIKKPI